MPQFLSSTLKAAGRITLFRRCVILVNPLDIQVRNSNTISGIYPSFSADKHAHRNPKYAIGNGINMIISNQTLQRRWFLGCGDGDQGSVLSKIHEERCLLGYSPEQLFDVVAAVDSYEDFVPWCRRSEIMKCYPDGSFDAKLEIGFKFLVESYLSHVVLDRPKFIKTTSSQSNIFEHLINSWEFSPGPTPDTCNLYFLIDFKFQSPLYRQVATMFFKEVVSHLVSSFTDRCRMIYGPEAQILQNN